MFTMQVKYFFCNIQVLFNFVRYDVFEYHCQTLDKTSKMLNIYDICEKLFTFKAPITTAADDCLEYFYRFSEKIRLDVSCESSV